MEINTITVFLLFKIRFIKLRQNIFINLFLSKIHSWWNFALFVLFTAAKNVTSREHTLKKSPIQVELWSPSQQCGYKGELTKPMSKDASTPSAAAHYKDRVLVSGVPSETTMEWPSVELSVWLMLLWKTSFRRRAIQCLWSLNLLNRISVGVFICLFAIQSKV